VRAFSNVRRRAARVVLLATASMALAACSEDLDSGAACPALCPDEALATRDTVLQPVVLDTTLSGYPGVGLEGVLPMTARGDTLDTRPVIRFDALPTTFTPAGGTATPYSQLTSATLTVPIDTAGTAVNGAITVEAYDVSADGVDTAPAALAALFTASRRLATVSFADRAALGDTLRLPLSPDFVLARITGPQRLRVGLLLRSAASAQVNLVSTENTAGSAARLLLRTAADTAAQTVGPNSSAAGAAASAGPELRDFVAVVRGPAAPAPTVLAAGGVFGRRVLLQFAVPPSILDSATVVRASLELTQAPNRAAATRATPRSLFAQPVTAAAALGDTLSDGALREPSRVASFLCTPTSDGTLCPTSPLVSLDAQYRLASVARAPADSGIVRIEIGALIRIWQIPDTPAASRVLVLRVPLTGAFGFESQQGGELLLYSKEAPPAVRPRLRLTYVTRSSYALP
jgi:hypothetical protein